MQNSEVTRTPFVVSAEGIAAIRTQDYQSRVTKQANIIKSKLNNTEALQQEITKLIIEEKTYLILGERLSVGAQYTDEIKRKTKFQNDILTQLISDQEIKIPQGTHLILCKEDGLAYDEDLDEVELKLSKAFCIPYKEGLYNVVNISIGLDWTPPEPEQKPEEKQNKKSCAVM